jgi:hypothetical protein
MHVSFEARALREYLLSCRVGRFADDGIFGDCVAREPYLSAFTGSRKADNLFDCGRNPVQGTVADMLQKIISTDFEP